MENIERNKLEFVDGYLIKLEQMINNFSNSDFEDDRIIEDDLFELMHEIISVFNIEIPNIDENVLFRTGTAMHDADLVIAQLRKFLVWNGYQKEHFNNNSITKFWISFKTYFENEMLCKDYLKTQYVIHDGYNYLNIDYNYQFNLHYGENFCEDKIDIALVKKFIELAFLEWIKTESRYEYTKDVNEIFRKQKLPYKLKKGKLVSEGYKTTFIDEKIINYTMLERKIQYAEEMILSNEILDKKCALDYIIDSLQYIISIQKGDTIKNKYSNIAKQIANGKENKVYSVIYTELNEIMKIANEYFDIRHNEYLNKANEKREAIIESSFIEYLYNRANSLLHILKLNTKNDDRSRNEA